MGKAANPNAEITQALIAYMIDEKLMSLHISPNASGQVLLAPEDWDIEISRDRNGIHVQLIDTNKDTADEWMTSPMPSRTVLNASDDDSGPF